jgi:hypothetical protein
MSDALASTNYLRTGCAWNPLSVFSSDCWAATYEALQYGRITRPGDVQQVVPAAPQTADQMTTPGEWTPDQALDGSIADYGQRLRDQIAADVAAGNYNPAGSLPVSAQDASDWWSTYKYWILGGACLVGGAVFLGGLRR